MAQPKGIQVPLVMVPRFTSYFGNSVFVTVALQVDRYARCVVTVWRGPVQGGGVFAVVLQHSHDAETWQNLGTVVDPGEDQTIVIAEDLTRRWLRLRIELPVGASTDAAVTCWASGYLEQRLD